jgi:hypothetical protein
MDAYASELLAYLQSSAFRDVAGSRVAARVPVSRSLLNRIAARALEGTKTPIRTVDIQPRAGDRLDVVVTVTWPFVPPLKIAVTIERQPEFPAAPVLVLRWSLFGGLGAIAARFISGLDRLPPGIRLDGERLLVDIPALAAGSPASLVIPYVTALALHTLDDRAVVDLEAAIPE